ncbi:hypothetical protein TI39_contig258g00004 [Zymoseptoria brevis]|uniref:Uncharacterized protein n=1 Tax=Zymoseptoria brevis TaxID=1047168 RepID=A0A0F4GXH5_9PEZI|nr:hypothetical protein TI39_contig258g00004 [Zymoseptoria brevis]
MSSADADSVWRLRFQHFLVFRYLLHKADLEQDKNFTNPAPRVVAQIQDLPRMEERFAKFIEAHDAIEIPCDVVPEPLYHASFAIRKTIPAITNWLFGADSVKDAGTVKMVVKMVMSAGRHRPFYQLISTFSDVFSTVYDGRRIFLTKNEYLGITVETVTPGDVIYLVAGAEVPFVLRPAKDKQATFTLAGEAYVHGLKSADEAALSDIQIV